MLKSEIVKPFRVAESPIQFECKVTKIIELGKEGGAGNLIICEVVKIHIKEEILDATGAINQQKLDLVARAGGNFYTRVKRGFFEIPKPLATLGIGVDSIPLEIRNSSVLTGNDLGKLGNVTEIPSKKTVDKFSKEHCKFIAKNTEEKHIFAKEFLKKNNIVSAWKVLLMK